MKRSVLFLEHCIDHTVGGSHYCLLEICRQFVSREIRCVVVFYESNDLVDEFKQAGAEVVFLEPHQTWDGKGSGSRSLVVRIISGLGKRFRMLVIRPMMWRRVLKRHEVDVLHLNNTFSHDLDSVVGAWISGVPVVAHVRGIQTSVSRSSVWFGNRIAAVVAISRAVRQRILDLGIAERQIRLVYDGISPDRIGSQRSNEDVRDLHGIPPEAPIIGLVGNVKRWKGQEVLVRAFGAVAKDYPEARCLIVGAIADDNYYQSVVEISRKAGVEDRVIFAGYQKNVGDYLACCDIFVHSSIEPEPFGIVILEAMSLSIPVVATSIGAPREIIKDNDSGLLFDPSDVSSLESALRRLLSDPDLMRQLGESGNKRFNDKFTSEINSRALIAIYDDVLV